MRGCSRPASSRPRTSACKPPRGERDAGGAVDNDHPTLKPLAIARWLVRLVTARGGLVLDPFAGSGTTALAAMAEGMDWLLVEREPDYAELARARIAAAEAALGEAAA